MQSSTCSAIRDFEACREHPTRFPDPTTANPNRRSSTAKAHPRVDAEDRSRGDKTEGGNQSVSLTTLALSRHACAHTDGTEREVERESIQFLVWATNGIFHI